MAYTPQLKLLAFVGLPGSGMSTAAEYLREKGMPSVYFGAVILGAMEQSGIERSPESEQAFRENFRAEHGQDAVVQAVLPQIHGLINAGQKRIVLDGLYSWTEYKVLKKEFPTSLTVVALTAPRHLRFRRLRDRAERPMTEQQAAKRDWSEIEQLEKGGPIAAADYALSNTGSREQLCIKIDTLLRDIEF